MNREYLTKAQVAAHAIREGVKHGTLPPGSRIDVHGVAVELGMSPTPIREALRLLEAEGLVVNMPHKGAHVGWFSPDHAQALYELRACLEEYATRRAVPRMPVADVEVLVRLAHDHRSAVLDGDTTEVEASTRRWHMLLYGAASEGTPLVDFISRLWDGYPWSATWSIPGRDEMAVEFHRDITDAVRMGDADRAAGLMRDHILAGGALVVEHLNSTSDLARSTPAITSR